MTVQERIPGRPEAAPSPHAPEVGLARRILGRYHVTGIFWYRFHLWGVSHLPSWAVRPTLILFTSFFFLTLRRIRRALAANLVPVLGATGWAGRQVRIWRTMWNHAWCNSERYERLSTERPFRIDAEGLAPWRAVTADRGRGFVLVTAHVGAWDVSSFLPSMVEGRPVHVVREQEPDPEAQRFIEEVYGERVVDHFTLHFSRDNPALGGVLLGALRRGEMVGIQGDRPVTTGRSVEVELFGRPFALPAGPVALARAAKVPIVPVFCFREGRRRYRMVVREPIQVPATDDPRADHEAALLQVAREVEWAIRQRPHQWFCFRDLWGER
jgi:KDO2-lipid IV(A) lauroyltransferase